MHQTQSDPVIVVLGGMGPMAGNRLHEQLIMQKTDVTCDQLHRDVVHLSFPGHIPDRSRFLLEKGGENPGKAAARILAPYLDLLENQNRDYRFVIPCATFHSQEILSSFFESLKTCAASRFIDMTKVAVSGGLSESKNSCLGVIATGGSISSRVWQKTIKELGGNAVCMEKFLQTRVDEAIFNPQFGIKAVSGATERSVQLINSAICDLYDKGVDTVIIGCTDMVLIEDYLDKKGLRFIDPVSELVKALNDSLFKKADSYDCLKAANASL